MLENKKFAYRIFVGVIVLLLMLELLATHFITPNFNHLVTLFGFVLQSPIRLGWASLISISIIELTIYVLLTHYFMFRYKHAQVNCGGFKQYCSMLYFNHPYDFLGILYKFPKGNNIKEIILTIYICPFLILWNLDRLVRLVLTIEWIGGFGESHLYRLYFGTHCVPLLPWNAFISTMLLVYLILFLITWFCFIFLKYKVNKNMSR